jgi:hypothetical protein
MADESRNTKAFLEYLAGIFDAIRMSCLPDTVDPRGPKGK